MKTDSHRKCSTCRSTAAVVLFVLVITTPIAWAQKPAAVVPPAPTNSAPPATLSAAESSVSGTPTAPTYHIPLKGQPAANRVQGTTRDGQVSLIARDASLGEILATLAQLQHVNIVCAGKNDTPLTVTLNHLPFDQALSAVVAMAGCTWTKSDQVIYVTEMSAQNKVAPGIQGRQLRVFPLDYLAAADVEQGIKSLLSPVGTVYVLSRSSDDIHKTVESIVVEDVPEYLSRIAQYIHQIDRPPRQVVIEVHVLQIELKNGCRHGINFSHFMNVSGQQINLRVSGFASASAPQAFFAELTAANMTSLLEALRTSTDAKTLAAPKILALNGQKAQIQVGEKLGYRVLETTQTSTLEDVQFLDVGVILEVTPTISRDNQILMNIHPKVSTGVVSSETGLPDEKTSEVTTNVLLSDGEGVVIGGLIQEENVDEQSKLMFLGDLYLIGSLFQRRQVTKVRKETIFFLLPRIIQPGVILDPEEAERAQTPLFCRPLSPMPRPWEPPLPNSYSNPTDPNLLHHIPRPRRHHHLRAVSRYAAPILEAPQSDSQQESDQPLPTPAELTSERDKIKPAAYEEPVLLRRLPPIDREPNGH